MPEIHFQYPSRGPGRPQLLLLGNGLEYKSNQVSWSELLDNLTVSDAIPISQAQKDSMPFPLLYQLLSTHAPAPAQLSEEAVREEEQRLKAEIAKLKHGSNEFLDQLPSLEADHILTTNYSYCIEKAFFPGLDFTRKHTRARKRFRCSGSEGKRESCYKLRSGYLAQSPGRSTGLWHIHGECAAPQGIILSHDRYGRLLQRIEGICGSQRYPKDPGEAAVKTFSSWPELFLYADVYILGLNLGESEFDLWWLLRRKQRERYADGRVYFYERRPEGGFQETRHLLMQATGVTLCDVGFTEKEGYDPFYHAALADIRQRIAASREG